VAQPPNSPPATAPPAASPRLSTEEIAELLARGDALLRTGDVASARLFYERATDAGDGGRRYGWEAPSIQPSSIGTPCAACVATPAQARYWYPPAHDLGEAEAERRLKSLETKRGGELR